MSVEIYNFLIIITNLRDWELGKSISVLVLYVTGRLKDSTWKKVLEKKLTSPFFSLVIFTKLQYCRNFIYPHSDIFFLSSNNMKSILSSPRDIDLLHLSGDNRSSLASISQGTTSSRKTKLTLNVYDRFH